MREQLAVLVSTGKAKEAIGVNLTHEDVKRLTDKDVMKYSKRYQTYVGAKTINSLVDSFIFLASRVIGMHMNIKDIDTYRSSRGATCSPRQITFALITTRHMTFANPEQSSQAPEQSSLAPEQSSAVPETPSAEKNRTERFKVSRLGHDPMAHPRQHHC